jgi:HD-GYP domain-containing protein (c-di-GMP phosphodiesterase class II)
MRQLADIPMETRHIQPGYVLTSPIYDFRGTLLLAEATEVTETLLQLLIERNVDHVLVSRRDFAELTRDRTRGRFRRENRSLREQSIEARAVRSVEPDSWALTVAALTSYSGPPLQARQLSDRRGRFTIADERRLADRYAAAGALVDSLVCQLLSGEAVASRQVAEIAEGYVGEVVADQDHVVWHIASAVDSDRVSQRSVSLAVLAMCIAVELGLSESAVRDVGICGVVHDWGMYRLPERLLCLSEPFSEDDWFLYMRHPLHTRDLLERMTQMPPAVRQAAQQVHERLDGTGYPYGLSGSRIHPFAQIVGVCDAYLCFTEHRRGRPAIVPHDALGCMLHHGAQGKFDKSVVAALLEVLTLFPIGSLVMLENGTIARVLRRSPGSPMRPVLESVGDSGGRDSSLLVDLRESPLAIAHPVLAPGKREMRIPKELMADTHWDG